MNGERIHFKNTHEAAVVLKGMSFQKAMKYLNDVVHRKRAVPFRRFNGGVGRTAQAKEWSVSQARWPVKSCNALLKLLKTASGAADLKGLSKDKLKIQRVVVNKSTRHMRRNYRAHGRMHGIRYNSSNVTIIIAEDDLPVSKSVATLPQKKE